MEILETYYDLEQSFFVQLVSDHGYYWDELAKPDGMFTDKDEKKNLVGPFLIESPKTEGYYQKEPLKDPTLFRQFAEIKPTREGILDFANQYGKLLPLGEAELLTPYHSKSCDTPPTQEEIRRVGMGVYRNFYKDGRDYIGVFGETFSLWRSEIGDMRRLLMVWDWLREKNTEKLRMVIHWGKDGKSVHYVLGDEDKLREAWESPGAYTPGTEVGTLAMLDDRGDYNGWFLSRSRPGDLLLPAQYLIQRQVNKKLKKYHTKPRLLMDDKNKLVPYLMPDSLLAALWFQFYQFVIGEKILKRCKVCGKWADITELPPGRRQKWSQHPSCANVARVRRYRERKRQQSCISCQTL